MKVVWVPLVLFLAACDYRVGTGACAGTLHPDPFTTLGKVQIDRLVSPTVAIDPVHLTWRRVLDKNGIQRPDEGALDSEVVEPGTSLTAVVKESCREPGAIVSQLVRGEDRTEGVRSYPLVLSKAISRGELMAQAEQDACLVGLSNTTDVTIEPMDIFDSDPHAESQGHLKALEVSEALDLISRFPKGLDRDVTVAVIDTGIDLQHEDLRENLWVNAGEIPRNGRDDDGNGYVDDVHGYNFASDTPHPGFEISEGNRHIYHHGTHVAGLLAAVAGNGQGGVGIMGRRVRIMVLNVFGRNSRTPSSHTENAIRYAVDNGADIINLSLGGGRMTASYASALTYAVNQGVVVFAAAGNESRELDEKYAPAGLAAGMAGLVAVGSIDSQTLKRAVTSNFSRAIVQLAAPGAENSRRGIGLLSTMPGNRYARISGTSMATPLASGGAALAISMLRTRGYEVNAALVEHLLTASARIVPELKGQFHEGRVLNLRSLVDRIEAEYPDPDLILTAGHWTAGGEISAEARESLEQRRSEPPRSQDLAPPCVDRG